MTRIKAAVYLNISPNFLISQELAGDNFDGDTARDNAVHGALGEGVKLPVVDTHEVRLQQVAGPSVVLKYSQVELHRDVQSLVVEGHQLTAGVPVDLRDVIGTLESKNKLKIIFIH